MADFNSRYSPGIVPSLGGPDSLPNLERFLNDEFRRISIAMEISTVQAAYGSLLANTTAPLQALDTDYELITCFDARAPANPNRTDPNPALDRITVLEAGVYKVYVGGVFTNTADTFQLALFVDGVETPFDFIFDPSNQTDFASFSINCQLDLETGSYLELYGRVTAGTGDLTMQRGATMTVDRISELHQVRR